MDLVIIMALIVIAVLLVKVIDMLKKFGLPYKGDEQQRKNYGVNVASPIGDTNVNQIMSNRQAEKCEMEKYAKELIEQYSTNVKGYLMELENEIDLKLNEFLEKQISVEHEKLITSISDEPQNQAFWHKQINELLAMDKPETHCKSMVDQYFDDDMVIVDFADITAYQEDHSYSIFAKSNRGICLLIPNVAEEDAYFAYPYPNGQSWYGYGIEIYKKLYEVKGIKQSTPPHIRIITPSLVQKAESKQTADGPILVTYMPKTKGLMEFID